MEHRATGVRPGLDEVEHEGRGQPREQREPVSQRHRLNHETVFVDQTEPAERLREGGTAAGYLRRPGQTALVPFVLTVLRFEHGRLTDIAAFEQPSMFAAFGLPASL
jgi:hypothetical protein